MSQVNILVNQITVHVLFTSHLMYMYSSNVHVHVPISDLHVYVFVAISDIYMYMYMYMYITYCLGTPGYILVTWSDVPLD